jgi:hypothetical protein
VSKLLTAGEFASEKLKTHAGRLLTNALVRICSHEAFDELDEYIIRRPMLVNLETIDELAFCGNDRAVDYLFHLLMDSDQLFGEGQVKGATAVEMRRTLDAFANMARKRSVAALGGRWSGDVWRTPRAARSPGIDHWSTERLLFAHDKLSVLAPKLGDLGLAEEVTRTLNRLQEVIAVREPQ